MNSLLRFVGFILAAVFGAFTLGIVALTGGYLYLAPQLPSTGNLKDVRLQEPLRIYTHAGELMAEFGEVKRIPVKLSEVPAPMAQAVLATEDDRFYAHPGVDYHGLLRASLHLLQTGEKSQGGSTITMQVARNFFLGREKTYLRKLKEILLALKIERELSKDEILELYLNKIYLGNRTYGVAAAAQLYYGLPLDQLSVAQMAMIAGLPKAPSKYNPIVNLRRAVERRNYVLGRMQSLGWLKPEQYQAALRETETARRHKLAIQVEAPYVAEMARAEMVRRYGEEAYTGGYKVFTTLDSRLQSAADAALRSGLVEYDTRHGYRKPEAHVDLPASAGTQIWERALADFKEVGGLLPALVVRIEGQTAYAYHPRTGRINIPWTGLSWAQPYIDENHRGPTPKLATDILKVGDIIRLLRMPDGQWRLAELPAAQGALVSLNPNNGAITSLVGGFYFYQSNFNRVTQADRQPGSSLKPFIYSAALDKGFTPATIINDAPVVINNASLDKDWRPENYGRRFYGPTRLRMALAYSRNLVSVRVLRAIGIDYTIDYLTRFGFKRGRLPRGLSLALGSSTATPLELGRGYMVFANGGYRVEPHLIERIEGADGKVLLQADPDASLDQDPASLEAEVRKDIRSEAGQGKGSLPIAVKHVLTPQNAYLTTSMMQDVIRIGTGRPALQLGRKDLAGKTGTTNDQRDAWFAGFNRDIVAIAWVGFDNQRPLGDDETGGHAALPIWMDFMRAALKGLPEKPLLQPPGIVTMRIDPETGLLAGEGNPRAISEVFNIEHLPGQGTDPIPLGAYNKAANGALRIPEQLF